MSEMAPEFDWTLGQGGDAPELTEPNGLDVQAELQRQTEQDGDSQPAAESGEPQTGRTRDASGRFVSAQQNEGEADAGESGGDKGDGETQEPELIAGKFKSVEELEAAYRELDSFRGRQGQEMGELRQQLDELRQHFTQQDQQPSYAPVDEYTVNALDQLVEQNPQQAAMWALANQPVLYERVMDNWFATDPKSASRFESSLALQTMQQQMEQKIAPTQQSVQQQTAQAEFQQAWANVAGGKPDMPQLAEAMMEAAQAAPELAQALQQGDMESKQRLIENLYWLARGRQADTVAVAATQLAADQAQQVAEAKVQATVAAPTSSPTAPGAAEDKAQAMRDWKQSVFLDDPGTSIFGGLSGIPK